MGKREGLSSHDRAILFSMGIDPKDEKQYPIMKANVARDQAAAD